MLRLVRNHEKPAMRPYSAANAMTVGSFPNMDKNCTGMMYRISAPISDTTPATPNPTPRTRLMESVSPLPQYWLMRTVLPLWTPKMNS